MTEKPKTLAEELADENELLHRRFVHHTRPKGPLTMQEAADLCRRMNADLGEGRIGEQEGK